MSARYLDPKKRHEFVFLFDVRDGNPNGDPDAGNLPRVDPETMHGLVTDVALKRKIRDYIALTREGKPRFAIFVQSRVALNRLILEGFQEAGIEPVSLQLAEEQMVVLGPLANEVDPLVLEVGMEMELVLGALYEDDEHEYVVWQWVPTGGAR